MNEPTNLKDRRRRIAKACDSCRQKKLKCDGIRPACSRCMQYDIACMYADVAKPPYRRSRNKTERHPDAASFGKITASLRGGTFSRWVHPALQPLFGRTVHEPLTTWEQALSLVNDYFHHENRHWPLFDHPTFTAYLGRQYTDDPPPESSWWAALNIILATAQRRKAGTDPSNWQEALNQAWKYVRNAMSAVLDILFHNISLLSVQALVSIGHFFLDTPNPQPTFILSSSAVRLGQAIGLHKQDCQSTHERTDQKQRARVFWCATILDQLACSKTGRPPAQKAEDYAVRLPEASEGETLGTCVSIDGKTVLENFRLDAHLSTIEADSFQRLDLLAFATTALFIIYIYTKRVPSGDRPWQDLEDMRSIVRFMRTQIDHGADSFIHDLQVAAEAACDSSEAAVTHANVLTADPSAHDRGSSGHTAHQTVYDDAQDKSMAIDGAASFEAPEPLEGLDSLHQQLLEFPWSFLEIDFSFGDDLAGFGF
ncbi:Glucosylceramidase [Verticillium dahliae VDG2]|nr:Glucosylceramidase [Verticillium dahliae VDG2]